MAVIVYGAGGQAKVILDLLQAAGLTPIAGLVDDNVELHGQYMDGVPVVGSMDRLAAYAKVHHVNRAVIAVGDNAARRRLAEHARSLGLKIPPVVHPTAYVSRSAKLGDGTVVLAGAIVGTHAKIGELCILNTRSSVDHDCCIGDFVHIGPGAILTGGVTVGDHAFIGAGSTLIPGIIIGDGSIVGAGATVIRDVPSQTTVVGTPAKPLATHCTRHQTTE